MYPEVIMPKLFRTDIESEADLKVHVADIRSEADLVIFETTSAWEATEPQIWCYTDIRGEADKVVCFVSDRWNADLVVFRTDIQSDAGWNDSSKSGVL